MLKNYKKNYNKDYKKTLVLHLKAKYILFFLIANIIAFSHLHLTHSMPKFYTKMQLSPVRQAVVPLGYYSEQIIDGLFEYRIMKKYEFLKLNYPKMQRISYEDFLLISKNTFLDRYSSNSKINRYVVALGNSDEQLKKNIITFVNINYEHFYRNYYIKRKKFIDDKISFLELLKKEFQIDLEADPIMVDRAISRLVENETKYKILSKIFFTDFIEIQHVLKMPLNSLEIKSNKATNAMIFTVYNLIAVLLVSILLMLQLTNLNIKYPKIKLKYN